MFKWSLSFGKVYFIMAVALSLTSSTTFTSDASPAGSAVLPEVVPLILPMFTVIGSRMG